MGMLGGGCPSPGAELQREPGLLVHHNWLHPVLLPLCRVSTEPCSLPSGSCTATNATSGCSGLQGLRLPGQGDGDAWPGSEPYTIAVLPLLPALPSTSVQFELHVTSAYVPPTFALTGRR